MISVTFLIMSLNKDFPISSGHWRIAPEISWNRFSLFDFSKTAGIVKPLTFLFLPFNINACLNV